MMNARDAFIYYSINKLLMKVILRLQSYFKERKMKKILPVISALILSMSLLAGCGGPSQQGKQLNLFTWEGMFSQETLDGFTEETGITVNYSSFVYDEEMLEEIQSSSGAYDLVIADDYIIDAAISKDLVKKLDKSKLSNYDNINPVYQSQFFDPENEYTVPFGAGIQTIVYDPSRLDMDITSYADLWDSKLADNLGIIDNYRVVIGLALKTIGESYNTENHETIKIAGQKLLGLAPNVKLITDLNLHEHLLSGEISAAVMYTSQVTAAKLVNPDLEVVFPKEGLGFGVMAKFIPSKARNADAAYAFIDYILRPEVSAAAFEYLGYYCTNKAAEAYIKDEYKDFLTLPPDFYANMSMIRTINAESDAVHAQIWETFKDACGG